MKQSKICKKTIYSRLKRKKILKYWKTHHDFKIENPDSVEWEPLKKAMNRLPIGLKRMNVKFTSGFIGNRHKMHQRKHYPSAKCPHCDFEVEKSSHVLRCNNRKTKIEFNKNINSVRKHLSQQEIYPQLQATIIKILKKWREQSPINPTSFATDFGIREAIKDQATIGWDNFILGRWSKK